MWSVWNQPTVTAWEAAAATRDLGQLPQLEPGESRNYHIDVEIIFK